MSKPKGRSGTEVDALRASFIFLCDSYSRLGEQLKEVAADAQGSTPTS